MLSNLLNRPCQIVRRGPSGVEDDYGNELAGETVVSTVCELQSGAGANVGAEIGKHEDLRRTQRQCFFPVGTDIDGNDRVIVDNEFYEVEGEPWAVRNPRTQQMSHVEAKLIRVQGEGGS